jgi:hypothetical protein
MGGAHLGSSHTIAVGLAELCDWPLDALAALCCWAVPRDPRSPLSCVTARIAKDSASV